MNKNQNKKIAIIGGGVAGLATAIKLKQLKLDVILFEAENYNNLIAGEHLGADGNLEFQKLGFPKEKLEKVMLPCREVRNAWGQSNLNFNESIFNPYGDGIILSRPTFDEEFCQFAESVGVNVLLNSRVEKIKAFKHGWNIFIKNQKEAFQANFLIDATGRNSKFYKNFKVERIVHDDLVGITKRFISKKSDFKNATHLLVESMPNGWWYSVQLATGIMVATFMTDASVLQSSKINQDKFWRQNLDASSHTKKRLSDCSFPENCFTQSARTHKLRQLSGENWLCVGDAAMAYDPLSSTGIVKGLRMGQDAALAVKNKLSPTERSSFNFDKKYTEQFENYLFQKKQFYTTESRWNHFEFWYKRNIQIVNIEQFTILPTSTLISVSDEFSTLKKLDFLKKQAPYIDFYLLFKILKTEQKAMNAMRFYLEKSGETNLDKSLLQGLEGMLQIGLVTFSFSKT